jgi:signal transduction histidine kinase
VASSASWQGRIANTSAIQWALVLVSLPASLAVVAMLAWSTLSPAPNYQRLGSVQRWLEPLPAGTAFNRHAFATLAQTPPDFSKAVWTDATLPDVIELPVEGSRKPDEPMARAWFRFVATVPADAQPSEPLALYGTRVMAGAYSVWVDGVPVWAELDNWRIQWNHPLFVTIPLAQAKPGQRIEVALAVPYQISQGYAVGSLYFGKASSLKLSRDVRAYLQLHLPMMGMLMVGLMGIFSLAMWHKRRTEQEHAWLVLTASALIVSNLQFTHDISSNDALSMWYGAIVDAGTSWLFLTFFTFALRFNKLRYPKTELCLLAFTVLNTVLTLPLWDWQVNALRLQHYITILIYIQMVGLFTWLAIKHRTVETLLFCLAIWVLLLTGLHDISYSTSHLAPDRIWLFPYGAFVLFGLAQYLLQRRYLQALGYVEQSNAQLVHKLLEQHAKLEAQQTQLIAAQREAAKLAERARLQQDIHDGIGSTLTSTLMNLRGNNATPQSAAQAVLECIEDIRIVMESLEPHANDLTTLLGSLRQRLAGRLEGAGIQLDWHIGNLPHLPWLDAPQALDLLRVIQEIVTNTLKHANATRMAISANAHADTSGAAVVLLNLQDNGQGFDAAKESSGRGLDNICTRLARMGAGFEVGALPAGGVRYILTLPVVLSPK